MQSTLFELRPPPPRSFRPRELELIDRLRTPHQVQRWLRTLHYNWERRGDTLRSFREVVARGTAHCLEAALVAAVILEQHSYPPILMSFESVDGIDHVIFAFRHKGKWGTVARSRDAGLHGRKPIFKNVRHLALSYFDPYVDFTGRLTAYALVNVNWLGEYDWRFNKKNMWKLEKYLLDYPHKPIYSSDQRYERLLKRYREFKTLHPKRQAEYYENRHTWW
ncbi:MAG TPA: hypothetical protein VGQ81_12465 [Acidobacteriota bacterium]|jgi:hypothetical protein|nr:hypothetical protein [Acidobacteriota bacterium]